MYGVGMLLRSAHRVYPAVCGECKTLVNVLDPAADPELNKYLEEMGREDIYHSSDSECPDCGGEVDEFPYVEHNVVVDCPHCGKHNFRATGMIWWD